MMATAPKKPYRLVLVKPPVDAERYAERVTLRLDGLWLDLGLPGKPEPHWQGGAAAAASIDGDPLPLPRQPFIGEGWEPWEIEAEAVAASLSGARWRLLRPSLAAAGVPWVDELEVLAQQGLGFHALSRLAREASVATDLPWMAADLYPPAMSLVVCAQDAGDPASRSAERTVLESAARWLGIALPEPALEIEDGLPRGRLRLRIGDVRGPALPAIAGAAADDGHVGSALFHHLRAEGWRLWDVGAFLQLLLSDPRVTPSLAGELLAAAGDLACNHALRDLLRAGFGLVDAASLCEDLLASVGEPARPAAFAPPRRIVVLPGATRPWDPGTADPLAARLQATAVPRHLLQTAWRDGEQQGQDAWTLAPAVTDALRRGEPPSARLLAHDELDVCAAHPGLLIVPADLRDTVRAITREVVPPLRVVSADEIPRPLILRRRGRISRAKDQP